MTEARRCPDCKWSVKGQTLDYSCTNPEVAKHDHYYLAGTWNAVSANDERRSNWYSIFRRAPCGKRGALWERKWTKEEQ